MSRNKPEPKKIGSIQGHDVVQYGESECLVLSKSWLSVGKVKAVLANLEACKAFVAQYDTPAPIPAAASTSVQAEKEALLARIKELEAKAQVAAATNNGHNRQALGLAPVTL